MPIAESIEWFTEDQASSPWYDLAPPPPSPISTVNSTGDTHEDLHVERDTTCCQEGGRGIAKSYVGKKAWSSINHLILSAIGIHQ